MIPYLSQGLENVSNTTLGLHRQSPDLIVVRWGLAQGSVKSQGGSDVQPGLITTTPTIFTKLAEWGEKSQNTS